MPSLRFLFDSVISPILLYGSEIWGYQKSDVIEKVHINACKQFLGVSNDMCNSAVLGECGRSPMYVFQVVRCIKYWFKCLMTDIPRYVIRCL